MDDQHDQVSSRPTHPGSPPRTKNTNGSPGTPTSSPAQQAVYSPRVLAVETLRRAASMREGSGARGQASPTKGVARLGLERSASDAARRVAMAKLTGEKIIAPPEYLQPKTPLPTGPLPSLADLQARHEQRMGLISPPLSDRYAQSSEAASMSRHTPSPDTSADAHQSPSMSAQGHHGHSRKQSSVGEDDEKQRKTDERQEARSNLIRKLSRGRLAAGAAAAARERAGPATNTMPSPPADLSRDASTTASPPILDAGKPEEAGHTSPPEPPRTSSEVKTSSPHAAVPDPLSLSTTRSDIMSPGPSTTSTNDSLGQYMSSSQSLYSHIPVPPTPYSEDSPVESRAGLGHTSTYSAVSNFRPYRHTVERDRDSAIARMGLEDAFEFDASHQPTPAFQTSEHEEERDEILKEDIAQGNTRQSDSQSPLRSATLPGDGTEASEKATPLESPLDAMMNIPQPLYIPPPPSKTLSPEIPPPPISKDSLPETAHSSSPVSPFTFSPTQRRKSNPFSQDLSMAAASRATPFAFTTHHRHHAPNPSTDSFPISVTAGSHSSRIPQGMDTSSPVKFSPRTTTSASRPSATAVTSNGGGRSEVHSAGSRRSVEEEELHDRSISPLGNTKSTTTREGADNTRERLPGPTSDYRFPSPTIATSGRMQGSRPTSWGSATHHDESMTQMIEQLEQMQAADGSPVRKEKPRGLAVALEIFSTQAQQDNRGASSQDMQSQDSATALHHFHATNEPALHIPHEIPATTQAVLPIPPATEADYAKYSHAKLAPFPGMAELERQRKTPLLPSQAAMKQQISPQQLFKQTISSLPVAPSTAKATVSPERGVPASHARLHSDDSARGNTASSPARTGSSNSSRRSPEPGTQQTSTNAPSASPRQEAKEQVMKRLGELLARQKSSSQSSATSPMERPPRQLLLHAPVLQVVNANTVKDRYLFLFSDILLIAKPMVEEDENGEPISPTLDTKFLVKSIVELPKLKLTSQAQDTADDPVQKKKHPLLLTFVDRFANDPKRSIAALISKAGLPNDASTIANLLFRNPELNRSQLGTYLSGREQKHVLKAYCERFRLAGVRIEDALRLFVGSLRLPNDYAAAEYLLSVFASQWLAHNPGTGMNNDSVFATRLLISIMELNDALHSGINDETAAAGNLFSFPNHAITVDDFIAAFRLKDPHDALPDEQLTRIYLAVRRDRIQQAADNSIASLTPEIEVITHPSKLPNRLTYRTPSENISFTIPQIDPKFSVKLVGQDLRFEPPLLTFARSRTATFRVTPTALGSKAMLFVKLGQNSSYYKNIPINKTFSVERAFMNHTFQIAFVNHLGVKRKYLFSMSSADDKFRWVETLRQRIENAPLDHESTPRATKVASEVALQVLRDALIAPDEPAPILVSKPPLANFTGRFATPPHSRQGLKSGGGLQRSNSFSKTYAHGAGKAEADLNAERRPSATSATAGLAPMTAAQPNQQRRESREDELKIAGCRSGNEITTLVQQNSLLPLVLGFMSAGAGVDALPRKAVVPQPIVPPVPPQAARGTGRFRGL